MYTRVLKVYVLDFIITHYDGDGYASGFILKKHLEAQGREVAVGIAEFLSFGVSIEQARHEEEEAVGIDRLRELIMRMG